jgi:hypothetical protein
LHPAHALLPTLWSGVLDTSRNSPSFPGDSYILRHDLCPHKVLAKQLSSTP